MTVGKYVAVWMAWDKAPRRTDTSWDLVDATKELAEQVGKPFVEVCDRLAASRRAGLSYVEAYNGVVS